MKITTSRAIIDDGKSIVEVPLTAGLLMGKKEKQKKLDLVLVDGKYYQLDNRRIKGKGFTYNKGIFKT